MFNILSGSRALEKAQAGAAAAVVAAAVVEVAHHKVARSSKERHRPFFTPASHVGGRRMRSDACDAPLSSPAPISR